MSDVVWIPGGLVGWRVLREVRDKPPAKPESKKEPGKDRPAVDEGAGLATRRNGEELLFGPRGESPLLWIPVGDFVVDPATIPEYEYVPTEEDTQGDSEPVEGDLRQTGPRKQPFGARRRGR